MSGAEISLLRIAPEVARLWDVHVVLGEEGQLAEGLRAAGVEVTVLPLTADVGELKRDQAGLGRVQPSVVFETAAYSLRLARLLRRLGADVVHSNSLKAGYYTTIAARVARVPMVWGAKDRIAEDYLPGRVARTTRRIAGWAPAVVANSKTTLDTLPSPRRSQIRAVVGEPPLPTPPPPAHRNGAPTRIGIVGRIAPWKGQDVFLDAFARAFPDGDEHAVVVGAAMFGEDDFEAELRRRAEHLGIADRVEFRGFRENIADELGRLDLLVHASVIPEPFGMVVVEGMASGMAVVASDAGGPAEVITHGVDGLLVEAGNVAALSEAMKALADDGALRQKLGVRARERAKEFEAGAIAHQLVKVYARVLAQSR